MNTFANFVMNTKKVKYSLMDTMFQDVKNAKVNFFIDMRFILNVNKMDYYKDQYEKEFVTNSNAAIGEFLNLIVHYKHYFVKHRKCNQINFIVLTEENLVDKYVKEVYPEFEAIKNSNISKPTFLKYFSKRLEGICRLVPNVFVINTKELDLTVAPCVIKFNPMFSKSDLNIFLSSDSRFFNMTGDFNNFSLLKPNKDKSRIVKPNGFFKMIQEENKYKTNNPDDYSISDQMVSLYESLVGFNNLPPLRSDKSKLIKILKKLDQEETEELFKELFSDDQEEEMEKRNFIINPYHSADLMTFNEKHMIKSQLEENYPSFQELCSLNDSHMGSVVDVEKLF